MSVNSAIFARQSKQYLYFDLESNFLIEHVEHRDHEYRRIKDKAQHNERMTATEILYVASANIDHWKAMYKEGEYRKRFSQQIIRFVTEHANDDFLIFDDHSSPSFYDIIDVHLYEEWQG